MGNYKLGIDIGGTKMRAVLLSKNKIKRALEIPTPKNKRQFIKNFARLAALAGTQPTTIGLGVAGVVTKTKALFCPNIAYLKNLNFANLLPPGAKLKIDNDARCFARGEVSSIADEKFKKIFVATIGTGVGRSFVENGLVKKIKRFEYPETWEREYQRRRAGGGTSALAAFLGRKLSTLIRPYRPDALILGGGVLANREVWLDLKQELKRHGFIKPIRRARFKKNSAALGAALI